MRSRRTVVAAILVGITLAGGGSVSIATIGSSIADSLNNEEPRFNATARCRDGTWTWSKQPDAPTTCSEHGGVAL